MTLLINVNTDPFLVFFAGFYLVMGLSVFFATKTWDDFLKLFAENEAMSLVMGFMTLPIALFIVVFYNNWDGVAPTVLMIVGYLAMAKSLMLLLYPAVIQKMVREEKIIKPVWVRGVLAIALGLALLVL